MSTELLSEEEEVIKAELVAFPGITRSMLWSRLGMKMKHWRPVLDDLLNRGLISLDVKTIRGRQVTVLYWGNGDE